ncbi:MAG: pyrroline-5-carboxylate reductase [Frankiaceae bacterium]|jgi:pyrroline-5-carboxylate reductase|nr:pyrroline-5-carboxylate reductase [Frankiaceae bacterium]
MTVAIIGAGKMGEAILAGLLRAGRPPGDVVVTEKDEARASFLTQRYGVSVASNDAAVSGADVVILAVKPQDLGAVVEEFAPSYRPSTLTVSIAAGVTSRYIEDRLPAGAPVIRVMPNTPALVGEGMSAVAPGSAATEVHLATAEGLLAPLGPVRRVSEADLDAVTAVSGSGPAYVFYLAEAMIAAGVEFGLDEATATELATQTIIGAGILLRETGTPPAELRAMVTSKGGTTAAAIAAFDSRDVKGALRAGLTACRDRSVELAAG